MNKDDDLSWIKEQERLEKINQNYYREPMDSIHCFFLFINANLYIEKITSEKIDLDSCLDNSFHQVLKKERMDDFLKPKLETKYELDDILLFNVTIEPNQIQNFANTNVDLFTPHIDLKRVDKSPFLQSVLSNDILIPPSIFIFHNVNALFFFIQEKNVEIFIPKSIIKSANKLLATVATKNTKKVKIIDHLEMVKRKKKQRMTRKVFPGI